MLKTWFRLISAMEEKFNIKAHDKTLRPAISTYCQRLLLGVEYGPDKFSDPSKNEKVFRQT
jgi:hypothetical protein